MAIREPSRPWEANRGHTRPIEPVLAQYVIDYGYERVIEAVGGQSRQYEANGACVGTVRPVLWVLVGHRDNVNQIEALRGQWYLC